MDSSKYTEHFKKTMNILELIATVFGANCFKEGFHMTWITWSVITLINIAIAFTLSTTFTIIRFNPSFAEILKSLCMLGTGVQGYVKLVNLIKKEYDFRFLRKEMLAMYLNSEPQPKYRKYLKQTARLQRKVTILLIALSTFGVVGIIGVPMFYLFVHKKRLFVMAFFVPMIDLDTDFGFYSHLVLHIICVVFGIYGNFANDWWYFLTVAHIPLHTNILRCKLNTLSEILEVDSKNLEKWKPVLRDIFQWHQNYLIFTDTVKSGFFWVVAAQVCFQFFNLVCTTVCIFLGTWPAAPVYFIYSLLNLYLYCGLGNIVELANDDICVIIYDSLWYCLPVSEQKMVMIMLRESQNTKALQVGDVIPLSLGTALQLTKTIYSVAMMLNQFLD